MTATPNRKNIDQLLAPLCDAQWMIGGALRFDEELLLIHQYLKTYLPERQFRHLTATPPCSWSLDWLAQRGILPDDRIITSLQRYQHEGIAISLSFDNPFIPERLANDDYGMGLVSILSQSPQNSLWVASDMLRDHLREHFPKLPIYAHPNRIAIEKQRRTPLFYQQLSEHYDRVAIHPRDGQRADIYKHLSADASRYIIITNDRCLANCPLRREHLQQLALRREYPYDCNIRAHIQELCKRCDCHSIIHTLQGKRANLSHLRLAEFYDLGFRHFAILDDQIRCSPELLTDIIHYTYNQDPEMQHILATFSVNLMSIGSSHSSSPSSGMMNVDYIPHPHHFAY